MRNFIVGVNVDVYSNCACSSSHIHTAQSSHKEQQTILFISPMNGLAKDQIALERQPKAISREERKKEREEGGEEERLNSKMVNKGETDRMQSQLKMMEVKTK